MRSMLQTEGVEFDKFREALQSTLDQLSVRTSTWGLELWEREVGLTPAPAQPTNERRDKIVSRIRGTGTATLKVIKGVAESYDKGSVDVIEDHTAYTVTIQFVDTTGVPPNLDDLLNAVRDVLPAHLDLLYEFNYFLWTDMEAENWTWEQLDDLNLTWDQLEVYN
jgi:hypothetical protein